MECLLCASHFSRLSEHSSKTEKVLTFILLGMTQNKLINKKVLGIYKFCD